MKSLRMLLRLSWLFYVNFQNNIFASTNIERSSKKPVPLTIIELRKKAYEDFNSIVIEKSQKSYFNEEFKEEFKDVLSFWSEDQFTDWEVLEISEKLNAASLFVKLHTLKKLTDGLDEMTMAEFVKEHPWEAGLQVVKIATTVGVIVGSVAALTVATQGGAIVPIVASAALATAGVATVLRIFKDLSFNTGSTHFRRLFMPRDSKDSENLIVLAFDNAFTKLASIATDPGLSKEVRETIIPENLLNSLQEFTSQAQSVKDYTPREFMDKCLNFCITINKHIETINQSALESDNQDLQDKLAILQQDLWKQLFNALKLSDFVKNKKGILEMKQTTNPFWFRPTQLTMVPANQKTLKGWLSWYNKLDEEHKNRFNVNEKKQKLTQQRPGISASMFPNINDRETYTALIDKNRKIQAKISSLEAKKILLEELRDNARSRNTGVNHTRSERATIRKQINQYGLDIETINNAIENRKLALKDNEQKIELLDQGTAGFGARTNQRRRTGIVNLPPIS